MFRGAATGARRTAAIGLGLLMVVFVLLVGTTTYQAIATTNERARFPVPGRLVNVGGYRLHLRCSGQGNSTVILESGAGMSSNEWALVQPKVTTFTRVCSYDRAGYGWSDAGPFADPVEVLHVLLRNGGVSPPYVIVGHSYGSGLARRYAYRYPSEVIGMVLAATSYPDEEVRRIAADIHARDMLFFQFYFWTTRLGLSRITPERYMPEMARQYFGFLREHLPPDAAESEIAFPRQTKHVRFLVLEMSRPTPTESNEDEAACKRGFVIYRCCTYREVGLFVSAHKRGDGRSATGKRSSDKSCGIDIAGKEG